MSSSKFGRFLNMNVIQRLNMYHDTELYNIKTISTNMFVYERTKRIAFKYLLRIYESSLLECNFL